MRAVVAIETKGEGMRFKVSSGMMQVVLLAAFLSVPAEVSHGGSPEPSLREVRSYEVEDFDHPSLRPWAPSRTCAPGRTTYL